MPPQYADDDSDSSRAPRSSSLPRNMYLSDAFSAYQGFWMRQGTYWYDLIGRFACGEYRVEDSAQDVAQFWDNCMADYQRMLQFPQQKAQAGQVPNVVFVLDAGGQGGAARQVPISFGLGRPRPVLLATPLRPVHGGHAGKASIRATVDERGYYASIHLASGGSISAEETHLMSVVYVEGSRLPVAVAHVLRAPGADADPVGAPPGPDR